MVSNDKSRFLTVKSEISVIIPCFNSESWIRETLKSVEQQGVKNLEVIVVDDGSTDGSVRIIEEWFPYIHLVRTENQGASKARNLGTKISKGKFIQYLDADDVLSPGKIKIQWEILKKTKADVAYSSWQKLTRNKEGVFEKGEEIKKTLENPEIDLFTDGWRPPHSYLFRRSIIEKVGGWNEKLPVIQDARFALDCALHGAHFIYCPDTMVFYRVHSYGSVSTRDKIAFICDILTNANEVENWWRTRGGISQERKTALLEVYGYAARSSFENDRKTFNAAYRALERLNPGYIPRRPKHLRLASKLLGYRRAEIVALQYRRCKSIFVS